MEKRLRQLGKSISPASLGMGLKAPPPKRTRFQTKRKTTSDVEGLIHSNLDYWPISCWDLSSTSLGGANTLKRQQSSASFNWNYIK